MSGIWDGALSEELLPCEDEQEQLRRFAKFLDGCRGDEAIEGSSATDFRVRSFHAAREGAFHRIGLVVREYAEVLKVTGDGTVSLPKDIRCRFHTVSGGEHGTVGNENVLNGEVVCDYCTVLVSRVFAKEREALQRIASLCIDLNDVSAVTMARFATNALQGRRYFEDGSDDDGI